METYHYDRTAKIIIIGVLPIGPTLVTEALLGVPTSSAVVALAIAAAFMLSCLIYFFFMDEAGLIGRNLSADRKEAANAMPSKRQTDADPSRISNRDRSAHAR